MKKLMLSTLLLVSTVAMADSNYQVSCHGKATNGDAVTVFFCTSQTATEPARFVPCAGAEQATVNLEYWQNLTASTGELPAPDVFQFPASSFSLSLDAKAIEMHAYEDDPVGIFTLSFAQVEAYKGANQWDFDLRSDNATMRGQFRHFECRFDTL